MKPPPTKRKPRWSFMMVEREGGRTVHLKWMKPLLAFWFLVTIALCTAAGGLYFLWDMEKQAAVDLKRELGLMAIKVERARRAMPEGTPEPEKLPLPAAVATADKTDSPMEEETSLPTPTGFLLTSPATSSTVEPSENMDDLDTEESDFPDNMLGGEEADDSASEPADSAAMVSEDGSSALPSPLREPVDTGPPPISVDAFSCKASDGRFRIRFNIRNILPDGQKASGHIIAVLEDDSGDPDVFIPAPARIPLYGGRPDGRQRGETYSISRFKRMSFSSAPSRNPKEYTRVRLYVFERPTDQLVMTIVFDLKDGEAVPSG